MGKLRKATVYVLILLFTAFTLVQAVPNAGADTQSGFILASAGKDGQIGTNDDIVATHLEPAAAKKPANISTADAVPSADRTTVGSSTEPKPLRQPNSDEIPIYTPEELVKIGVDPNYPLNGKYILMANLDLSGYSNWVPIGNGIKPFKGQFDGNGLVISNLTINRPTNDYQGLFGHNVGKLTNISLENVNVIGKFYTGGLVGYNNYGTITNSYSTGNVKGRSYTGGLVGWSAGTITNSYSTGSITGSGDYTGGLVGWSAGTITNSYFTGSVTGNYNTGGLAGYIYYGTITNNYSTGSINGNYYTGGLVGQNWYGTITNSYSTGSVNGNNYTGSLVGYNSGHQTSSGTIYYAQISNSYCIKIDNLNPVGGQGSYSKINNVYAKTSTELKQQATFVGWDFTNVWAIDEGKSYPYLRTNEQIPHPGTN